MQKAENRMLKHFPLVFREPYFKAPIFSKSNKLGGCIEKETHP
jgi:hypothetical protein